MIWRVRTKGTVLDFGSQQAAVQFLDNYSPHIREKVVYKEITSDETRDKIDEIKSELSRQRRDDNGDIVPSTHLEWLLSRLEFYENALPLVLAFEQEIEAKEQARIGKYNPSVNEIWRDEGELQRRPADSI